MQKIVIEGYSRESMEDALADAMGKASAYLSERYDVNIAIRELTVLPGRGYKAVIEVTIVLMGDKDRFRIKPQDVAYRQAHEQNFRALRKREERHLKDMITNHFSHTVGGYLPDIPDYLLFDMNEARLLNYEIERAFFNASRNIYDVPAAEEGTPALKSVLGRRPVDDREPE